MFRGNQKTPKYWWRFLKLDFESQKNIIQNTDSIIYISCRYDIAIASATQKGIGTPFASSRREWPWLAQEISEKKEVWIQWAAEELDNWIIVVNSG